MITIAGTKVKSPTGYTASLQDITQSERNAKGTMFTELIAKKWKLELSWASLKQEELTQIFNALETTEHFSVTFINPKTGGSTTSTFYKGDRKAPMYSYINSKAVWKDFAVNLIEV